jgi:hypothetical protein
MLIHPGPLNVLTIFGKVTESVPFKFPVTYGATKFNLAIGNPDNFPIAGACTAIDMNFLPD